MAQEQKYKKIELLLDFCIEETTVTCDKCGHSTSANSDAIGSSEWFYSRGWRGTSKHCYCPVCAKKYLKAETN